MRIQCAKSTKPLGVRGRGEASFLFCPLAITRRGSRKKYAGSKVLLEKCQNCVHYRGVHRSMDVELAYANPFGHVEQIGEKKIILTVADAEKQVNAYDKWNQDEENREGIEGKRKKLYAPSLRKT